MKKPERPRSSIVLHTIGHSNHPITRFVGLLEGASIEKLVDVRSHPGSRFHPQFNKAALANALKARGIAYYWLGEALGGKPKNSRLLAEDGRPDYQKMAATPAFGTGIEALMALAGDGPCAIMCAEEDPARCHRTLLVAPALMPCGLTIRHIRGNGRIFEFAPSVPMMMRHRPPGRLPLRA